ncbi:MAG TPA: Hsp70 family protein, partial [Pirellulales bacterium]|nr:Hsp70 family protein [Pirellulales bacterium]
KTQSDGQDSVLVRIVEGESPSPEACTPIGTCVIRDLPKGLPARSPVEVEFRYAADGRLTVRVKVVGSDHVAQQEIARDNGLSREQLEAWRAKINGHA